MEVYLDLLHRKGIDCEVARFPGCLSVRCRLLKHSANFDAVLLHKKRLNFIEVPLLRHWSRKIIYDFDDAVMYRPRAPQCYSFFDWMRFRLTVKSADLVIAGNPYLAERARRFNANVEVLPTGLKTNDYKVPSEPRRDGKVRLVWIGSRSTLGYLTEIKPALEEIGSRFDNVVLRVICDTFPDFESMPIERRLWSEQTQTGDLTTSDIGLAPLPDNRFTRGKCGFKILQYASAGLPIIASPVGVNCDYVHDNVTGFHASNTQEWIDRMARLVEDPVCRTEMGVNALKSVESFDVSVVGQQLAVMIHRCAGDTKS